MYKIRSGKGAYGRGDLLKEITMGTNTIQGYDVFGGGGKGGAPCRNGHEILFAGTNADGKFPEGYPCRCGQTMVHYEYCPHCQQSRLVMIPVNQQY
jgi:hypothetical protein